MFWGLFTKKKKISPSPAPATAPITPKAAEFTGSLPPAGTYYGAVQSAVEALQAIGFTGLIIRTDGENSGHMWTRAYEAAYADLQDFLLHGRENYETECKNASKGGGPTPDWDTTRFLLQKAAENATIHVRIMLPENDVSGYIAPPPAARWRLTCPVELAEHPAVLQALQLLKEQGDK